MKNIMCSYYFYGQVMFFLFHKKICAILLMLAVFLFSSLAQGVSVSARSAAVIEMKTGAVLFEKNADERLGMASTTKIMTAICAIENGNPDDIVNITEEMTNIEGSSIYLKAGEKFTLEELLYGLMLHSGNDAAVAIAIHVGGDVPSFVHLMNETAKKIGLLDTSFQNPNGLYENTHYTTAKELALLTAYACQNELFSRIISTKSKTIGHFEGTQTRYLTNHNRMLKMFKGADGVKTGFTKQAGRCLVTSATREDMRLVCVTLNAPDDWRDHTNLLNDCFEKFTLKNLLEPYSISHTVPVTGGKDSSVPITNLEGVTQILEKESVDTIEYEIQTPHFFYAPIQMGTRAGTLLILKNGEEAERIPLMFAGSVEIAEVSRSPFAKLSRFLRNIILNLFG